ncbi:MAG: hypothetical protein FJ265_21125, partial [Planctomycetes bacterium]|nr:hypothetical protein [Planctomycetota bacterium]
MTKLSTSLFSWILCAALTGAVFGQSKPAADVGPDAGKAQKPAATAQEPGKGAPKTGGCCGDAAPAKAESKVK